MAVELNSTTPLENMIEIIEKFNLNHPGVFDDRVIKKLEILNKLKYTIFIFSYLLFIWKIHVLYRFFILLFIYLIQKNYYLWKKKNDVGKRVLERCSWEICIRSF